MLLPESPHLVLLLLQDKQLRLILRPHIEWHKQYQRVRREHRLVRGLSSNQLIIIFMVQALTFGVLKLLESFSTVKQFEELLRKLPNAPGKSAQQKQRQRRRRQFDLCKP